jgi:hypothetical protein
MIEIEASLILRGVRGIEIALPFITMRRLARMLALIRSPLAITRSPRKIEDRFTSIELALVERCFVPRGIFASRPVQPDEALEPPFEHRSGTCTSSLEAQRIFPPWQHRRGVRDRTALVFSARRTSTERNATRKSAVEYASSDELERWRPFCCRRFFARPNPPRLGVV